MNQCGHSAVPMPEFESPVASMDEAFRSLLSAGMPPDRLANLAGKEIDHISRELEEEARQRTARAQAKVTAVGKLLAKEEARKKRRAKQRELNHPNYH